MARRGDWLEAPRWWRRYKPLRWMLAAVILAWIYVQATRMEREPAPVTAQPEARPEPPRAASGKPVSPPVEAPAPQRATPNPPPVKKKAPEERQQKNEIRSLRPV
jgi:hypothetical protein